MIAPAITPMPPQAAIAGLPWDAPVPDPVTALRAERARLGDTFVVDSGADRYLFTFSARGVAAFYELDEAVASKGVADWKMLRRKLPDEIFVGRRTLPGQLFGRDDVADYLRHLEDALDATLVELGDNGVLDVFSLTRRLAHRMGLGSWGSPGANEGERFELLVAAFDELDGSESFVHPDGMAAVERSDKAAERAAADVIVRTLAIDDGTGADQEQGSALYRQIVTRWHDADPDERRTGAALDIALIHIASMSNLYAAMGWAVIDLATRPEAIGRITTGDALYAEQCALESTRLAQRSIMSRSVLQLVRLDTGAQTYDVEPGVTIATLLPLTNTTAADGLAIWHPEQWSRRRLVDESRLPAPQLVTAFGHGRHKCPAQPFALAAITRAITRLYTTYRLTPLWSTPPQPVAAQIGGVARSADPCQVNYERR